jgi:hypothetical protein
VPQQRGVLPQGPGGHRGHPGGGRRRAEGERGGVPDQGRAHPGPQRVGPPSVQADGVGVVQGRGHPGLRRQTLLITQLISLSKLLTYS